MSNNAKQQFAVILKNINKMVSAGSVNVAREISQESLKVCPMDTGELRESFKLEINGQLRGEGSKSGLKKRYSNLGNVLNNNIEIKLTYESDHALWPHEMDDTTTNWTTEGTHSKYLENPAYEFDIKESFLRGMKNNNE